MLYITNLKTFGVSDNFSLYLLFLFHIPFFDNFQVSFVAEQCSGLTFGSSSQKPVLSEALGIVYFQFDKTLHKIRIHFLN